MYFRGKEMDCMKIKCQLFHYIEMSYKQGFVKTMMNEVEMITKIPVSHRYMTTGEYDNWGKNGELA